jgi:uncharacterized protein YaaN involved in tellurite resistance
METAVKPTEPVVLPMPLVEGGQVKNLPSVTGAMEIQSSNHIVLVRPKHVDDARDAEIQAAAQAVVAAILENPSDISLTASVYGLGADAEAANAENVSLVDTKIGPVMKEIGTESQLGKSLVQIKANLDLVNPHIVGQTPVEFTDAVTKPRMWGLLGKQIVNQVVSRLPVGGAEVMTVINGRRDTVRETVATLKGHLWAERDKALRHAVELAQVADRLADTQDALQEATYQGQLMWQGLSRALDAEIDPVRKQALTYLVNDLAVKVVDLQTVDQLNIQSRMGAETLINNCRGIQILVSRVTNTLLPSVLTALAVKAAAAQQAELASAAQAIGAAAGDTIAQTAKDIGGVSVAIAKANANALIDVNKLEEACAAYEAMQKELDQVVADAEQNARGISVRLSALNGRMRDRADPQTAARRAKELAGV